MLAFEFSNFYLVSLCRKICIRKCHQQFKPSKRPSNITEELADEESDPVRPGHTRHRPTRLRPSRIPSSTHQRPSFSPPSRKPSKIPIPTRQRPTRLPPSRIPSPTHHRPTFSPPSRKPSKILKGLADEDKDPDRPHPTHHRPTFSSSLVSSYILLFS